MKADMKADLYLLEVCETSKGGKIIISGRNPSSERSRGGADGGEASVERDVRI